MGLENQVIPTRFLCLMAHLTAVLMLFWTRSSNVKASLQVNPSSSDVSSADSQMVGAIWASIVCFIVDAFGFFGGFSMFLNAFNTFHIFCHFCGCILTSWLILESWNYKSYWYIFGIFCLIPAFFEVVAVFRSVALKTDPIAKVIAQSSDRIHQIFSNYGAEPVSSSRTLRATTRRKTAISNNRGTARPTSASTTPVVAIVTPPSTFRDRRKTHTSHAIVSNVAASMPLKQRSKSFNKNILAPSKRSFAVALPSVHNTNNANSNSARSHKPNAKRRQTSLRPPAHHPSLALPSSRQPPLSPAGMPHPPSTHRPTQASTIRPLHHYHGHNQQQSSSASQLPQHERSSPSPPPISAPSNDVQIAGAEKELETNTSKDTIEVSSSDVHLREETPRHPPALNHEPSSTKPTNALNANRSNAANQTTPRIGTHHRRTLSHPRSPLSPLAAKPAPLMTQTAPQLPQDSDWHNHDDAHRTAPAAAASHHARSSSTGANAPATTHTRTAREKSISRPSQAAASGTTQRKSQKSPSLERKVSNSARKSLASRSPLIATTPRKKTIAAPEKALVVSARRSADYEEVNPEMSAAAAAGEFADAARDASTSGKAALTVSGKPVTEPLATSSPPRVASTRRDTIQRSSTHTLAAGSSLPGSSKRSAVLRSSSFALPISPQRTARSTTRPKKSESIASLISRKHKKKKKEVDVNTNPFLVAMIARSRANTPTSQIDEGDEATSESRQVHNGSNRSSPNSSPGPSNQSSPRLILSTTASARRDTLTRSTSLIHASPQQSLRSNVKRSSSFMSSTPATLQTAPSTVQPKKSESFITRLKKNADVNTNPFLVGMITRSRANTPTHGEDGAPNSGGDRMSGGDSNLSQPDSRATSPSRSGGGNQRSSTVLEAISASSGEDQVAHISPHMVKVSGDASTRSAEATTESKPLKPFSMDELKQLFRSQLGVSFRSPRVSAISKSSSGATSPSSSKKVSPLSPQQSSKQHVITRSSLTGSTPLLANTVLTDASIELPARSLPARVAEHDASPLNNNSQSEPSAKSIDQRPASVEPQPTQPSLASTVSNVASPSPAVNTSVDPIAVAPPSSVVTTVSPAPIMTSASDNGSATNNGASLVPSPPSTSKPALHVPKAAMRKYSVITLFSNFTPASTATNA